MEICWYVGSFFMSEERANTQNILKDSQTTLNPNKISYTNDICLILVHRNRAKSSTHIWSNTTNQNVWIRCPEDERLRDRIVTGTSNNNVRAWLLSESGLTRDRAIDICRSTEHPLHQRQIKKAREFIKDCRFCGKSHDKGKCQAYGLTCAICLKRNHIVRVCQSQAQPTPLQRLNKSSTQRTAKVRYVETEAVSSDESIYAMRSLSDRKHYHADVCLSTPGDSTKIACKFQLDTGASCSTLAFAN